MANIRLIDANAFFETYPELAIEPYINFPTVVWCDECEKALTCEKRKVSEEIDGCYDGIKVGDT